MLASAALLQQAGAHGTKAARREAHVSLAKCTHTTQLPHTCWTSRAVTAGGGSSHFSSHTGHVGGSDAAPLSAGSGSHTSWHAGQ